jgi:hypothetical protein
MSKIENENVEIQATEIAIDEIKPEGFFTKAGKWIAKHKVAVAVTAAAGVALAFIGNAIAKSAKDDSDEVDEELLNEAEDFDFETVESDE